MRGSRTACPMCRPAGLKRPTSKPAGRRLSRGGNLPASPAESRNGNRTLWSLRAMPISISCASGSIVGRWRRPFANCWSNDDYERYRYAGMETIGELMSSRSWLGHVRVIGMALALGAGFAAPVMAQAPAPAPAPAATKAPVPGAIASDPITCWWKTDTNAVQIGQHFTLTLTCSVLESGRLAAAPDVKP